MNTTARISWLGLLVVGVALALHCGCQICCKSQRWADGKPPLPEPPTNVVPETAP